MGRLSPSLTTVFLLAVVLQSCSSVSGHNKTRNSNAPTPPPALPNQPSQQCEECQAQASMDAIFAQWIAFVGKLALQSMSLYPCPLLRAASQAVQTLIVCKNPKAGEFSSIQAAVDSIPPINFQRFVIKISAGVYTEKVYISAQRAFITLEGEGADKTIIQAGGDHSSNQGEFSSFVLGVNAPNFIAKNITFHNVASEAATLAGVAARVSADAVSFLGCKFLSAQNALYDHTGRHYYKDCHVEGGSNFLFGQAPSMFEGCFLKASSEASGEVNLHRSIGLTDNSGKSFNNCKVMGAALFFLGKAWESFSRVVITNSYLDNIEMPKGIQGHDSALFQKGLNLLFGVHQCSGPGLNIATKKSWAKELTASQVMPFTSLAFIEGHAWVNF